MSETSTFPAPAVDPVDDPSDARGTTVETSVVIPSYNAATTIGRAIESVQDQTYSDWQLIVVDDGSTDGTKDVIRRYADADPRIQLLTTGGNSGSPAMPRNVGVGAAAGRFIAFLDSDDFWAPGKLETQVGFMKDTGAEFSATGYLVTSGDKTVGTFLPPESATFDDMLKQNAVGCSTAVYDSAALGKRTFPRCGHEDYALWLDITREGHQIRGIRKVLATYSVTPGSVSSRRRALIGFYWHIYRTRMGFSLYRSALTTGRYLWHARSRYTSAPATAEVLRVES